MILEGAHGKGTTVPTSKEELEGMGSGGTIDSGGCQEGRRYAWSEYLGAGYIFFTSDGINFLTSDKELDFLEWCNTIGGTN